MDKGAHMMEIGLVLLIVAAGVSFGSFVTLVSYRLPRDKPIAAGRSQCPQCDTVLGVPALFPVFSWLWQRGRCRYCGAPVSVRYPVIELVQALLFLLVYAAYGLTWEGLLVGLLSVALLVMVVVDFEWYIIPDEVQIAAAILAVLYHLVAGTPFMAIALGAGMGALIGGGLHYGYRWLMRKEGLGFGDVKFLVVAGLWMASIIDWPPFLFYSGCWGVVTALVWRALGKGARFPFGPALAASLLSTLLTPSSLLFYWTMDALSA